MSKIILSIFINRAFPHITPAQLRRASSHQSTSEHSGHQQGTPGWPGTTPWNPQQSNFRLRLLNVKDNLIYIHAAPLRHETTKTLLKALPLLVSLDSLRPLPLPLSTALCYECQSIYTRHCGPRLMLPLTSPAIEPSPPSPSPHASGYTCGLY